MINSFACKRYWEKKYWLLQTELRMDSDAGMSRGGFTAKKYVLLIIIKSIHSFIDLVFPKHLPSDTSDTFWFVSVYKRKATSLPMLCIKSVSVYFENPQEACLHVRLGVFYVAQAASALRAKTNCRWSCEQTHSKSHTTHTHNTLKHIERKIKINHG